MDTCGICSQQISTCGCMTAEMLRAKCAGLYKLVYYRQEKTYPVQNRLIYRLKRERDVRAATFVASELKPTLKRVMERERILPERTVVTYLPRAAAPRLQSGTDQARELAKAISVETAIPLERLIQRGLLRGKQQKRLTFAKRLQNAKATYRVKKGVDLRGRDVFLVDDVVTSGAGMAVCTRLLRKGGAGRVFCLSVAIDDIQREGDGAPPQSKERG